jgi:hypothetical protein
VEVLHKATPSSAGGMIDLVVDRAPLAARRMLQRLAQADTPEQAEQLQPPQPARLLA